VIACKCRFIYRFIGTSQCSCARRSDSREQLCANYYRPRICCIFSWCIHCECRWVCTNFSFQLILRRRTIIICLQK